MRRQLPSMISLSCFAAFARHMSVTRAAEELNLTQSAVSRQIKNLEDMLGCPLVEKVRQRLLLTDQGREYVQEVSLLLDQLEAATMRVRSSHSGRLRVGAEPSFTTRWLLPKLKEYARLNPEIELEIMNDLRRLYDRHEGYDVGILYGDGDWPEFDARLLMEGEMVAVCTPDLLERFGPIVERRDILRYPLLHHSSLTSLTKSSTQLWLHSAGLSAKEIEALPGQRLEHFQFVLDAALHGLGATVLPRFFVDREVKDGHLVVACQQPLVAGKYYVVIPKQSRDPKLRRFADWLLQWAEGPGGE
ncbi:Glycine cleavage system transcriptional activator [compost metagenome]|jgi:DNA-binding transcriptional LysR family regulator|uniref:LysR substrate-binding domain-containing protein n=1 Tax=Metapseudomonas lalkuanensis TaxID=2604832 RepID=UPI001CF3C984|nr:LysR substrate-binding domain-containing protein [Pseudomonas lalkuanensis]UCP00483.1 LysR family transcriptional regulator [Pseudomonas lalkuanensis]